MWASERMFSVYAALFMTKVTEALTLAYGAWTPNTAPGDYGGDWSDYGVVINPLFKYKAANHPGLIQAMLAYSSKNSTDVGNPRLLPGLITGNLPTKSDNWIVELAGEQYFWEPNGASVPPTRKCGFDDPADSAEAEFDVLQRPPSLNELVAARSPRARMPRRSWLALRLPA